MITKWENSSIVTECANPEPQDIRHALDNRRVLWRYKNDRIQVLAQTLSNRLDTRTSSLLAVNKKQGVPAKYIHREWKQTWVDLEGLKQRVNHTEHESSLLKGLKQIIQCLDELSTPDNRKVESASASAPGTKRKPIDVCDLAVEANKRAVQNTERLNKLTRDEAALENLIFKYRDACSVDLGTQSKRLDMLTDRTHDLDNRVKALEHDVPQLLNQMGHDSNLSKARTSQLTGRVHDLEDRVHRIEAGDKQATQLMAEGKTPLDALSRRVSSMVTHTDRLDAKTDGLENRVSVLEDTSKWLSWSLATVLGVRLLGLTLRLLRRK